MKKLTIIYGDLTLADGVEVDEFQWSETANTIGVVGKIKQAGAAGSGASLLDLFRARQQTTKPTSGGAVIDADTEG